MRERRQKAASGWYGGLTGACVPPVPLGGERSSWGWVLWPHASPQLPTSECLPPHSGDNSNYRLVIRQWQPLTSISKERFGYLLCGHDFVLDFLFCDKDKSPGGRSLEAPGHTGGAGTMINQSELWKVASDTLR